MINTFDPSKPLEDSSADSIAALKARELAELEGRLVELKEQESTLNAADPSQHAIH